MPRERKEFLTVGEVNKIIDAVFHPQAKRDPRYWLVDWLAHDVVEQDPITSLRKFAQQRRCATVVRGFNICLTSEES